MVLLSASAANAQGDCRMALKDIRPIIDRYNPFFTDHTWEDRAKTETARLDPMRLLIIRQKACLRHHIHGIDLIDKIGTDCWSATCTDAVSFTMWADVRFFSNDFLKQYLSAKPGPVLTTEGEHLGQHEGLMYHTIGQRQGLRIGGLANHPEAPWYVVDKDCSQNTLIVAQGNNHPALYRKQLVASEIFWINGEPPEAPFRCSAKIRYRQADQSCLLRKDDAGYSVIFDTSQRAITPGQSVVFYDGDVCLGGGVIESAL